MYIKDTLTAGQGKLYHERGDFIRFIKGAAADLKLTLYKAGRLVAQVEDIGIGYSEEHPGGFDSVYVESTGGQAFAFVVRYGASARYDTPPTGAVTLSGQQGAFGHFFGTAPAAAAQVRAANAARRYVLIQNKDTVNAIFVRFDGGVVTADNSIMIAPGGQYDADVFVPTGAIMMLAAAGTPKYALLEG